MAKASQDDISEQEMKTIIDKNRKGDGSANFAAIGRELGRDGETAKSWIIRMGLFNYTRGGARKRDA